MICEIPPLPPERGYETSATVRLRPRYEDITQDGRLQLITLMPALGGMWKGLDKSGMLEQLRVQAVMPILQRLVICGEAGPFSVNVPIECTATWRLTRETEGERIFLDMWLEARAPNASTLLPPPPEDAERVLVGRVYAEHVFTRPFGAAAERRVTRLDVRGLPAVPEDTRAFVSAESLVEQAELTGRRELRFGLMHTDSNQHVNSLVYPRVFEETVSDDEPELLARSVELRYRKPFFVGDRAAVLATKGTADVILGAFSPPAADKPSCSVAMKRA